MKYILYCIQEKKHIFFSFSELSLRRPACCLDSKITLSLLSSRLWCSMTLEPAIGHTHTSYWEKHHCILAQCTHRHRHTHNHTHTYRHTDTQTDTMEQWDTETQTRKNKNIDPKKHTSVTHTSLTRKNESTAKYFTTVVEDPLPWQAATTGLHPRFCQTSP